MYPPKRIRFRKHQKGRTGSAQSNQSHSNFARYAIVAASSTRLRGTTIEAVRRTITRKLKRSGQVWVRLNPDLSVTAKPLQVRMGKGKGSVSYWACRVKKGQILFEIDGVDLSLAKQAYALADSKLPMKSSFLTVS